MSKHIVFTSGVLSARYDSSIHGSNIPPGAIKVSEELFLKTINEQDGIWSLVEGEVVKLPFPPPTFEEVQAQKLALVQSHLDSMARGLGYDDIKTAVTYAEEASVPKFQAEGQTLRECRSLTWSKCYEILAEVTSGTRPIPSDEELIAELPALVLPA